MAKVSGPLMSMDASGKFAGTLVFTRWKGRPVVRQLVTPSNPQSAGQLTARNAVRVLAAGQHFANATALVRNGETLTDKAELITLAPSGQAWNGFLVKSGIGAGQVNYDAAGVAWAAIGAPAQADWDTAADALVPAMPAVTQDETGSTPNTTMSSGEVFFHYCYALYVAGAMAAVPGAVPPVYA
jgi:hypothetical protein